MSYSPERFCLGGLMKELDKDSNPDEDIYDNSKEDTLYKSSQEYNFSSNDSTFSFQYPTIFSPNLEKCNVDAPQKKPKKEEQLPPFSKEKIFSAFKSQKSTKLLQKSLQGISKETVDTIIQNLSGKFRTIIKSRNGNYFCSDLLKVCNKSQIIQILKELSPTLIEDCTDEFGTHPIQNLFELASTEEEFELLMKSFTDYNRILMSSLNQNGSFVIQKLIVHIPENIRMDFNLKFVTFVCILARDMYGVCTVKKFIAYTKNELILKQVLNLIMNNFINISGNQYGNYLIQCLLEQWWNTEEGEYLKKLIVSKFQTLAENPYSYYICDLFLKFSTNEERKRCLSSLNNYKMTGKNNKNKITLWFNKYAVNNHKKKEKNDKADKNEEA